MSAKLVERLGFSAMAELPGRTERIACAQRMLREKTLSDV